MMIGGRNQLNAGAKLGMAIGVAMLLAGCVTPQVVQSVQPSDAQLTCDQLAKEVAEAEKLRSSAEGMRSTGLSSTLKLILLFPAWALDRENINTAVNAAESRKAHLTGLMNQKSCAPPKPAAPAKPRAK